MIDIKQKKDCCGCNACGDVCAHQAITFKTDIEGFWYPEVDKDKCTDCHLCEKVCPIINIKDLKKNDFETPSHTYAAIHNNLKVRWDSTSGGAFSALAILSAIIQMILSASAVPNIFRAMQRASTKRYNVC